MNPAALFGPRWLTVALVGSLVLNGFLLGMIVTDALDPGHRRSGPRVGGFELRRLAERLPDDAIDEIEARLEAERPKFEARLDELRSAREEVYRLAAQPAPDRAAIDARLAALRAEYAAMQEEMQRATYDALLSLPPEVRVSLAE